MKKIDIEQAEPIRKKFTPSWEIRKGTYLYKKVAFNDYNQVLRFLMAIEKPQIKLDHFADFMNFYNELTIAITTHDVKGLTQLDFELALYIDKALEQMDARQLEESVVTEGYKLQLERDTNMMVLNIVDAKTGKRTEVRGKPGYETNYDPNDKLHQLLDKVGKSANISELINGEVVTINPKHPDAKKAKAATDVAYNEEFDNIKKIDLQNALDRMAEIAANGDRLKDVFIMRNQHNMTFKQIGDEIGTKTDRARQVYLRSLRYLNKILQDYNVEENFADGKVKGKSRPGRVKRSGASCNGSVTELRKRAKNASGEKAKMYHWCANMKSGKKK
jgi:4a-hydroxytetrahydrobiopterin dehydratase